MGKRIKILGLLIGLIECIGFAFLIPSIIDADDALFATSKIIVTLCGISFQVLISYGIGEIIEYLALLHTKGNQQLELVGQKRSALYSKDGKLRCDNCGNFFPSMLKYCPFCFDNINDK